MSETIDAQQSHASSAFLRVPFSNRCSSLLILCINHTQYADNTQLYIQLSNNNTLLRWKDCFLLAVHGWFAENGLALNPEKSEVIVTGTGTRNRQEGPIGVMTLGDAPIAVFSKVKSLGITLEETLSFDNHVDNVCRAAHFHITALRHIQKCVDFNPPRQSLARWLELDSITATLYCTLLTSVRNLNKLQ